jgi:hypothetical protein
MRRRRLLQTAGGVAAFGLAGCAGVFGGERIEPRSVVVTNRLADPREVSVSVRSYERDRTVFSRDVAVESGERRQFDDVLTRPGRYRIVGETPDGDADDYDRLYAWRENGSLTGLAGDIAFREGHAGDPFAVGAFQPPGVGNPPADARDD